MPRPPKRSSLASFLPLASNPEGPSPAADFCSPVHSLLPVARLLRTTLSRFCLRGAPPRHPKVLRTIVRAKLRRVWASTGVATHKVASCARASSEEVTRFLFRPDLVISLLVGSIGFLPTRR